MDTSVTTNDGTQERAAQTMPGRDELRDAIGRVVALHKSEYDWYDDPGAVVEERITGTGAEGGRPMARVAQRIRVTDRNVTG